MEYKAPTTLKRNHSLEFGIEQVKHLVAEAPDANLAALYRTVAVQCRDAAIDPKVKKYWTDEAEILEIMETKDIADEFKSWFTKAITALQAQNKKDETLQFLKHVGQGILEVARRS